MPTSNSFFPILVLLIAAFSAEAQTPVDNCGCETEPLPQVLAIVNGRQITLAEIETPIKERVTQLRHEVIEARKAELDLEINSLLLEAEAKKRGISTADLITLEVEAKVSAPTDAETESFYAQNKAQINSDYEDVKERIVDYLRENRERELERVLATRLRTTAPIKIEVPVATPPVSNSDRDRVFAVVNGTKITSGDIEDSLRPLIFRVQQQMYSLRKSALDMHINDLLLEAEAKARNLSAQALLAAEVDDKAKVYTEQDALQFFNENKERLNGDFASLKVQIIDYLNEKGRQERTAAYAAQLRKTATIKVFLPEPVVPVYKIATDDQPTKGNPKALVTIIEFTDYQCPSCAQQHPVLERIAREFGDQIYLVVRDFPLSGHKQAWKAAEAAEAAREQNRYWEFVSLLYQRQSQLQPNKLKEYATELGLDRNKFDVALDSGKFSSKIKRDVRDGDRIGVDATPSLFINGRPVSDRSYEGLKAAIEALLKKG